ncbi:MAG: penicillin-binding protein 1C [Polyangiaceae bacterium]
MLPQLPTWLRRLRPRRLSQKARRRLRRVGIAAFALLLLPWILLAVAAAFMDLPPPLKDPHSAGVSLVVRDRHGVPIREYRAKDGMRARWVPLSEMGSRVPVAMIAAEDLRFRSHPGVDPLAIARAGGQAVFHRRLVSGASTLTQQLARNLFERPRTAAGKLHEMALAVRIEASLSKDQILEEYLNRIPFGPGVRGIEAASRFYFDKPSSDLSLAESAALAGLPRGPSLYNPKKGTARLLQRRNTVLARMRSAGLAPDDEIDRALAEPLVIAPRGSGLGSPHLVRALTTGKLPDLGQDRDRVADLTLTLDRGLQRTLELAARDILSSLKSRRATAASVVVIENETGDILAYLGSHDFEDEKALGQNDGVLALRQPGSSLKPFVYGLAMEKLGFTPATLLADVETHFPSNGGDFAPNNYDGRFHGPVLLREALANSYNVPAVRTAAALGPERVLERLRAVGFESLDRSPNDYGVAIALGDGEVRLLDLANAYATIARRGTYLPVRAVKTATLAGGEAVNLPPRTQRAVMDPAVTLALADMLSDDRARAASFGRESALSLPFPVAVKTGTSKGYRDNLTAGFTREVTVAVWVGNFDGSAMEGISGVTGAAPLFHLAMTAAQALYPHASRSPLAEQLTIPGEPPLLRYAEICPLSGRPRGPDCPHGHTEVFPVSGHSASEQSSCDMHVHVAIDKRNGLRAGHDCPSRFVDTRVYERHPPDLASWARSAGRPVVPAAWSPLCPASPGDLDPSAFEGGLRISYPPEGAVFVWDPHAGARQSILLRAEAAHGASVVFLVNGRRYPARPGEASFDWPLAAGHYSVQAESGGQSSSPVSFEVEAY